MPLSTDNHPAPELRQAAALLAIALGSGINLGAAVDDSHGGSNELILQAESTRRLHAKKTTKPTWRVRLTMEDASADMAAHDEDTVLVLRRATPALRQALRDKAINFIDLGGAVHLRLPWLIVDRTDLPRQPLTKNRASPIDPFGDHNSRVVRVLLESRLSERRHRSDAPRPWGVRELAAVAGVDRTTTSKILRRLAAWKLLELDRRGRSVEARVTNPLQLIDRWSASYDWTANASVAVHAPMGDPHRFLARLPELLGGANERRWALTLQAGASLLAPHATWERLHLYFDAEHPRDLADFAAAMRWRVGKDGNVVLMRPFYRTSVWDDVQLVRKLPVVGALQLIIDLWQYPLRGREQAEHLLEQWPDLRNKELRRHATAKAATSR